MTESEDIAARIQAVRGQLREVHGIRGRTLFQALRRSRLFLPRHVRKAGFRLAEAERMLGHPKLERVLDIDGLRRAHETVSDHLRSVDVADLRRGRILGIAAAMAVNLMLVLVLFLVWVRWVGTS